MKLYTKNLVLCAAAFIIGCSSTVNVYQEIKPAKELNFIDIVNFDRQLAVSLKDIDETVNVAFYEKVSPNQIPERLQKWIASVEQSGGRVNIEQPKGEMVAKEPFGILSIITSIISGAKKLLSTNTDDIYKNIKGRDAVIELERSSKGEIVVAKINFIKRK